MSTENQSAVSRQIANLAAQARREAERMPEPDVESILLNASRRTNRVRWVVRSAAAAATLIAAVGTLLLVRIPGLPEGPVPVHISALVDSLYSTDDYVHDEIVHLLDFEADPFMDEVWESVVTDVEGR